jgi:outer membrane protein assembly factor BamB
MLSAERFIAILEEKDLLPAEIIAALRKQVKEAKKPPGPATIAQRLVRQKYLTPLIVERLLAAAGETPLTALVPDQVRAMEEEELGLAPLDDDEELKRAAKMTRRHVSKDSPPPETAPSETPTGGKARPGKQQPHSADETPSATPASAGGSLLDDELPPLSGAGSKGPLDALADAGSLDDAASGAALMPAPSKRKSLRKFFRNLFRRKKSQVVHVKPVDPRKVVIYASTWGGAVLLAIVGFGIFWYLSPPGVDALLQTADLAYETGRYGEALDNYTSYLERFPEHPRAGGVRVRCGLARIRVAIQEARESHDWTPAFRTAQEAVGKINAEPAKVEGHRELGLVLAMVAEGLAIQARDKPDAEVIGRARATVSLEQMNVPSEFRPGERLAEVEAMLAVSERQTGHNQKLEQTLAAIQSALAEKKAVEAYNARNTAVKEYPELADSGPLEEALTAASRLEQAAVKVAERRRPAETTERHTNILATLALAQRTLNREARAQGRMIFAAAEGAVFGLDAATGKVLWRRFIAAEGERPSQGFPPLPLGPDPGSDVILTDRTRNEVLRVEGTTGRLLWRQALEARLTAEPVRAGNRLLVPTEGGRLAVIDLLTGDSPREIQLPQSITVPPTVDAERSLIFQAADQSNLYVLALGDGACRQVFHLGYGVGGVAASPVVAGDLLLVAVNEGPKESTLRVLAITPPGKAQEAGLLKPVQKVRLRGCVKTSPVVRAPQVLVATAQGGFQVFEIDTAAKTPLESVARSELAGDESGPRFPLMQGNTFWIADEQLAKYDVQAIRGRVVPRLITDQGSTFLQPLLLSEKTIFQVRRKKGMPGVLVAAVDTDKHDVLWQTQLAVPLLAEPLVDPAAGQLTAVTVLGGMYEIGAAAIQGQTIADQPSLAVEASKFLEPMRALASMPGGAFAMTPGGGSNQVVVFDPSEQPKSFRWLLVPEPLACSPLYFADGLLAPCKTGRVYLIDPRPLGSNLAEPFQPTMQSVTDWTWQLPTALGADEALLSDGDKRLFQLKLRGKNRRAELVSPNEVKLGQALVSPAVVAGNTAYVVDDPGQGGVAKLLAVELPELRPGKQFPLDGRVAWGPRRVGKYVLLATAKDRLYCFDDRQSLTWQVALPYGPLAGVPLAVGDEYFLTSRSGVVWRMKAANGEQLDKIETGAPLATGPVLLGGRLLVGSADGSLYEVKRP